MTLVTARNAPLTFACPYDCPGRKGSSNLRFPRKLRGCVCEPLGAFKVIEGVWPRAARRMDDALVPRVPQQGRSVADDLKLEDVVTGGAWAGRPRPNPYAKRGRSSQSRVRVGRTHEPLDLEADCRPSACRARRHRGARSALRHHRAPPACEAAQALEGKGAPGSARLGEVRPNRRGLLELRVEAQPTCRGTVERSPPRALPQEKEVRKLTRNISTFRPRGRGAPGSVDRPCTLPWLTRTRASSAPPRSLLFGRRRRPATGLHWFDSVRTSPKEDEPKQSRVRRYSHEDLDCMRGGRGRTPNPICASNTSNGPPSCGLRGHTRSRGKECSGSRSIALFQDRQLWTRSMLRSVRTGALRTNPTGKPRFGKRSETTRRSSSSKRTVDGVSARTLSLERDGWSSKKSAKSCGVGGLKPREARKPRDLKRIGSSEEGRARRVRFSRLCVKRSRSPKRSRRRPARRYLQPRPTRRTAP
jgi:hypothetical protein